MKKIMNNNADYVLEMLNGLQKSHKNLQLLASELIIYNKNYNKNKVNLISGGGAGHEPSHGGFVGHGMLSAAISGHIFSSPSANQVSAAINKLDAKETLLVIKNYTGDVINFKIATQMAHDEDKKVDYIIVDDDVAVQNSTWTEGRRGVAGTILIHKIAGASAEQGKNLQEVKKVAEKVKHNMRTIGVSLEACVSPSTGELSFTLLNDEYEFGIGIHGEPGIEKTKIVSSHEVVKRMLDQIMVDKDFTNKEVVVLVNGMGGTPLSELYIAANDVFKYLESKSIHVYASKIGDFMTSLDMKGFSITLLEVDRELKELYDYPADTPAWKQ